MVDVLQVARQDNDLGYLLEDVTADGANNFLVDQLVGLGTAKANEPVTGIAETLATQARDAKLVVGRFEQIHGQPVRCDAVPI